MSKYRTLMPTYLEDWRQKDGGDGGYGGGGNLPPLYDHFTVYPTDPNEWQLVGTTQHFNGTEINIISGYFSSLTATAGLPGFVANYIYNRRMYIEFSGSFVSSYTSKAYINIGGGQYRIELFGTVNNANNDGSYFRIRESANVGNTSGVVYFGDNGGAQPHNLVDYTVRLEYNVVGFLDYSVTGNGATYTGTLNHTDAPTRQIVEIKFEAGNGATGKEFRVDRVEADNL
jgi:hypothetical protein